MIMSFVCGCINSGHKDRGLDLWLADLWLSSGCNTVRNSLEGYKFHGCRVEHCMRTQTASCIHKSYSIINPSYNQTCSELQTISRTWVSSLTSSTQPPCSTRMILPSTQILRQRPSSSESSNANLKPSISS